MYVASPRQSLRRPLAGVGESAASAAPWLIFGLGAAVVWLVLRKPPQRRRAPDRGNYDSPRSW